MAASSTIVDIVATLVSFISRCMNVASHSFTQFHNVSHGELWNGYLMFFARILEILESNPFPSLKLFEILK